MSVKPPKVDLQARPQERRRFRNDRRCAVLQVVPKQTLVAKRMLTTEDTEAPRQRAADWLTGARLSAPRADKRAVIAIVYVLLADAATPIVVERPVDRPRARAAKPRAAIGAGEADKVLCKGLRNAPPRLMRRPPAQDAVSPLIGAQNVRNAVRRKVREAPHVAVW